MNLETQQRDGSKANYDNWVPAWMGPALAAGSAVFGAASVAGAAARRLPRAARAAIAVGGGVGAVASGLFALWTRRARRAFDYNAPDSLSRTMVEGVAYRVDLPPDGHALDVGCGSGALTIALAKRNPHATVVGIDKWGTEYSNYSLQLCEENAKAEGVSNVVFARGNALALDFADETFDGVVSNYVYHNIAGRNKQKLVEETLRVLKKGGVFAIHDLMSPRRFGDMDAFVQGLLDSGYEDVRVIDTTQNVFMTPRQARSLLLKGSYLLVGRK